MPIQQTIPPTEAALGLLTVSRYLPAQRRQMVGPFIFLDRGGPIEVPNDPAFGLPEHPHAGLSTFTYLLSGSIRHRDSANNTATIHPGDMALMVAGSGITHEEVPNPDVGTPTSVFSLLQLWLALPDDVENTEPRFELIAATDLPVVDLNGGSAKVGIGSAWGAQAPTTTHAGTIFAHIKVDANGTITIPADWDERALLIVNGQARAGSATLDPKNLHILMPGQATDISSTSGSEVILLGGDAFPSKRYVIGSFVGSSERQVREWITAYDKGDFPTIRRVRGRTP